jgi:type I restriction enzyme S subunit
MSSKAKSSAKAGSGSALVPKLRFPEFQEADGWDTAPGDELFQQVKNREAPPGLPILAITQEHGAIPRHMIDYHVSVTDESLETYKEVRPGDFIISLRSFQGGIEFSNYHGICSPAYVILRERGRLSAAFYRQHFKSHDFIRQLTRNLEGLRDGKMITYKQFSELKLVKPTLPEQEKIADCLDSADALIAAQGRKVGALRAHKRGLMQQLFPQEGETQPRLRFPEFRDAGDWKEVTLAKFIEEFREKSTVQDEYEVMTSARSGLVRQRDYYDNDRITERNNVGFNLVPPNYITYRSRSDNRKFFFNQNNLGETGIVSVYYPVFRILKGSNKFFIELFSAFSKIIGMYSVGTSQTVLSLNQLKKIRLPVPDETEQQRIANCLTSLDDLIAAEARKLDTLKTHKKGLMQQLFPRLRYDA